MKARALVEPQRPDAEASRCDEPSVNVIVTVCWWAFAIGRRIPAAVITRGNVSSGELVRHTLRDGVAPLHEECIVT